MENRMTQSQKDLAKSTASELQKLIVGTATALNQLSESQEQMPHRLISLERSRHTSRGTKGNSRRHVSPVWCENLSGVIIRAHSSPPPADFGFCRGIEPRN